MVHERHSKRQHHNRGADWLLGLIGNSCTQKMSDCYIHAEKIGLHYFSKIAFKSLAWYGKASPSLKTSICHYKRDGAIEAVLGRKVSDIHIMQHPEVRAYIPLPFETISLDLYQKRHCQRTRWQFLHRVQSLKQPDEAVLLFLQLPKHTCLFPQQSNRPKLLQFHSTLQLPAPLGGQALRVRSSWSWGRRKWRLARFPVCPVCTSINQ